jgi:hypothetical protein
LARLIIERVLGRVRDADLLRVDALEYVRPGLRKRNCLSGAPERV